MFYSNSFYKLKYLQKTDKNRDVLKISQFLEIILMEHIQMKDSSESKLQIMSICPVEIRNNFKVIIKIRGFSKVEKSTLTLEIESIPNSPGSLKL